IYEYNGCFWHACPTCYPKDRTKIKNPRTGHSLSETYAQTQSKTKYLESCGYKVITKWKHEFTEDLKINPELKEFVSSLDLQERLDPRDSFFGGRTNAIKLHHLIEEEEEIRYVDFTSLYPYVNKYKTYPVGHPEIITRDFKDLNSYFGIAKIKILAPRGLYLPVLPYRSGGKLKFPLCRTCADNETQDCCMCTDDQRAMIGTWCIPEIEKATEKGYRILKIYEVYHFPQTSKYDTETKSGGLFAEYIDTFLKFKQESSDWPAWCDSQGKKEEYLQAYQDNEGVQLDPSNICKNPGLRSLAKLKLNSFWGKFGQRQNFVQSSYFTEDNLPEFYQLLSDSTKELKNFHIINDKLILVEYKHAYLQTPEDQLTNIFLATFTTCWARLHLYDVMDQLGDRVLYHDTDSIIYVHSPNMTNPQLGDYLGQLTNELDQNDYIIEYCSAGPKNYAYKTKKGKNCCKVRGFRLNFSNSLLIHFDAMKDIITINRNKTIQTSSSKILRDKLTNTLYNKQETKTYQMVYDKRVLDPFSNQTFPYGY
ncbi:MAG: DNA polymerase, partial [Candidatus Thiodiazotropha sp.]